MHREASSVNESSVDMITDVVGMALFQVLHGHTIIYMCHNVIVFILTLRVEAIA